MIKEDEDQENEESSSFTEKKDAAATASSLVEKQKGFAGKVSVVKLKKVVPSQKE